ncbi:hypothetical protein GQ53DRAFT_663309, partial [Thozetella sp. PMI_491]
SVFAGKNCKCQDPSGTGEQWNDLTKACCDTIINPTCFFGCLPIFGGNCLDSGKFNNCCVSKGAPGAFCWG